MSRTTEREEDLKPDFNPIYKKVLCNRLWIKAAHYATLDALRYFEIRVSADGLFRLLRGESKPENIHCLILADEEH
jgi:hypothetical protein